MDRQELYNKLIAMQQNRLAQAEPSSAKYVTSLADSLFGGNQTQTLGLDKQERPEDMLNKLRELQMGQANAKVEDQQIEFNQNRQANLDKFRALMDNEKLKNARLDGQLKNQRLGGGGDVKPTTMLGYLQSLSNSQLAGATKSARTKAYQAPLDSFQKIREKELPIMSRAQNALKVLTGPEGLRKTGIKAVQTMLAKASGEVGNLTEAERAAFGGEQSLMAKINRWATLQNEGDFTDDDRRGLIQLANVFAEGSKARINQSAKYAIDSLTNGIGADKDTLKNLGASGYFGLTNQELGLEEAVQEAIKQEAQQMQPASQLPGIDMNKIMELKRRRNL